MNTAVFITGVGRKNGIGFGMVQHYLQKGYHVFATTRSPTYDQDFSKFKERFGSNFLGLPLDVTSEESLSQAFEVVRKSTGHLDILINNAGRFGENASIETGIHVKDALETFHVNAVAPSLVSHAFMPLLLKGPTKKLIHITSMMGSIADNTSGGYYGYRMSKAALNMVSKGIAVESHEKKLISVVLHPGWVQTDMGGTRAPLSVQASVQGMASVIDKLTLKDSGHFFDYTGKELLF